MAIRNPPLLSPVLQITSQGQTIQRQRMAVISENLANAHSRALNPNEQPYQRKIIKFKKFFDKAADAEYPISTGVVFDQTPFVKEFSPNDPGADAEGMVKKTNVHFLREIMDAREAGITYSANQQVYIEERNRLNKLIDVLLSN